MASREGKREEAARRARVLYARLLRIKPADLTERQWTIRAGVSSSFFTNMAKGSEPSIGNLRLVLDEIGVSLPEFFVHEAEGKLLPAPNEQELADALRRVLPGLPKSLDRRAEYLAATVSDVLGLPARMRSNPANGNSPDEDDPEAGAPPRAATK